MKYKLAFKGREYRATPTFEPIENKKKINRYLRNKDNKELDKIYTDMTFAELSDVCMSLGSAGEYTINELSRRFTKKGKQILRFELIKYENAFLVNVLDEVEKKPLVCPSFRYDYEEACLHCYDYY